MNSLRLPAPSRGGGMLPPALSGLLALLVVGFSPAALTGEAKVPDRTFDATAAREFPQAIFDRINAKITRQTTFLQRSPDGLIQWRTQAIELIDFVRARSPKYPDTDLYAMRYAVWVRSEKDSLAVYATSCQAVVVHRHRGYSEPTVACAPVNIDRRDNMS